MSSYQTFVMKLDNVDNIIFNDNDISYKLVNNINLPLHSLGYNYYLSRTKNSMSITKNFESNNEFYYVVNPFEVNIHIIKDNLVSPRFKNSSSSSSSQLDTLDGNISDGNGSELTSRQEGASGSRDETAGLTKPKDKTPPIKWSVENEKILVEWCDVAVCYKWMHTKAHQKYSRSQAWYTIPAIVLSTISGTASFAQGNIPAAYQSYAPLIIGTVNIFIGILTTIQQYLKISELNEGHRIAGISWDKFSRNIRIELAKDPNERMKAEPFLKMSRQEFDRLMETSPSIPPEIIKTFMTTFGMKDYKTGFDITKYSKLRLEKFEKLIKPDVCDLLISSAENRHHWYQEFELVKVDGGVQTDLDSSMNDLTSGTLDKMIAPRVKTQLETSVEDDILKREETLRKKEQEVHDMEMQLAAQQWSGHRPCSQCMSANCANWKAEGTAK
jgi:hypothetical protein